MTSYPIFCEIKRSGTLKFLESVKLKQLDIPKIKADCLLNYFQDLRAQTTLFVLKERDTSFGKA